MIKEFVENKKVLFIGNSKLEKPFIDTINLNEYEVVVKFNHNFSIDSRCDILVHNMNPGSYTINTLLDIKKNNTLLLSRFDLDTPFHRNRREYFEKINNNINVRIEKIDEQISANTRNKFPGIMITSGFSSLIYFLEYLNSSVTVAGFDFYRSVYEGEIELPGWPGHNPKKEFFYVKEKVIKEYKNRLNFIGSIKEKLYD